jgi:O-6-methylguanine DNA methyltransferase
MSIRQADGAFAASYETRWGEGWVYVRNGRLIGVDLPGEGPLESARAAGAAAPGTTGLPGAAHAPVAADAPNASDTEALAFWARELTAYFAGDRTTWTAGEVPLAHLGLGTFEQAVYETLLSIPPGDTVSYGELAERAGYPRAARAVGNAMADNPIPVVVPCHRVIRSDGTMGRYGNDPRWKERLLVHEGWSREAEPSDAERGSGEPPAKGS